MALTAIDNVRLEVEHIPAPPPASGHHPAPLVFLHEGLGSVAMWRDWPARLCQATRREGWVYSRRGYGQSDAVPDVRGMGRLKPDYLHHEAWTVLPALLKALNVLNPVLVGHSDGGSIALLHASHFKVAACVVMAPHIMVEDLSIQSITQARVAFESGALRQRLAQFHADVDCAFWQWNDVWLSDAFRSFDIRRDCARITAPMLAIQGVDDPYGTMRQIDEIRLFSDEKCQKSPSMFNSSLQKLEHCGHSPHRDQTALTTQLIADFLKNQVG
jgi:pimeloyl-ACP methyl ester carboxylesterase